MKKASPNAFVPVITLRRADYEKVRAQIHDLPGTVFQEGQQLLAPSRTFAQPLLGRVGPATADVLKEVGAGYDGADQLGVSGLQRALNDRLTGKPGLRISTVDRSAHRAARPARQRGRAPRSTARCRPPPTARSRPCRKPAALVAIRPSTGRDPRGRRQRAGPVRDRARRPVPGRLDVQDPHLDRAAAGQGRAAGLDGRLPRHHGRVRQGVRERGQVRPRPDRRCGRRSRTPATPPSPACPSSSTRPRCARPPRSTGSAPTGS